MFAAGYAACVLGALKFVASQRMVALAEENTATTGTGIGKRIDGLGFGLDFAEALIAQGHVVSPYSHATRNNVDAASRSPPDH